jgi:outer membrane lipoprotein SlyB
MFRPTSLVVVSLALLASACAPLPPAGVPVYSPAQAMRPQTVEMGFVEDLRPVRIGGSRSGAGAATGAFVGGVGGSFVGGSWEANVVGMIVGTILGAFTGAAIEEGTTARDGVEVSVRLDNGGLVVVVQDAAIDALKAGDRVRVVSDGITARVAR